MLKTYFNIKASYTVVPMVCGCKKEVAFSALTEFVIQIQKTKKKLSLFFSLLFL